jgi:hypothetical protein
LGLGPYRAGGREPQQQKCQANTHFVKAPQDPRRRWHDSPFDL